MTLSGAQEPDRPHELRRVRVRGGDVPVWSEGTGRPLLLLHGLSANGSQWLGVARRLAPRFRVLVPDLLGRGASRPEPDADFTLSVEVDRLVRILREFGSPEEGPPPLVAGHSHGAALAVALSCRIRVAGLVLVNPVTPWTRRPLVLDLLRHRFVRRAIEPLLRACRRPLTRYILTRRVYGAANPSIEDAVRRYADPYSDRERGRALLRVLRDWHPGALEPMRPDGVPIEVLAGSADRRIGPEEAGRWAAHLGAGFAVVDGAGHAVTEEAPDRVAETIRSLAARDEGLGVRADDGSAGRQPRESKGRDDE